jgi:hypothetical protein
MYPNNIHEREVANVSYLLINAPLTDPTAPYHSISYLVGAASSAGYQNFSCLDANIAALNYLAQSNQVEQLLATCESARLKFERKKRLTRGEQLLYRYALKGFGLQTDSVMQAIDTLKGSHSFYDYGSYRQAVLIVKRWLHALSVYGFPGQFGDDFAFNSSGIGSLASIKDLTDISYLEQLMRPFSPYFKGPLTAVLQSRLWDVVGLSVNYVSQLPCAVFLARMIRSLCPGTFLCVGGTEVSDDVKYLTNPQAIWTLFPDANALVIGEGESAFVDILDAVAGNKPLSKGGNGILLPDDPESSIKPRVKYEDVASLASPRYDIWDWNQYWSPEPVVLYSPTRGCYWNKCTFCDYGLNTDSPTSPSRERPIELAVQDLQVIAGIARTVYLAVDAISPRYLRKLSNAITSNGLIIRWSAELRFEPSFSKGLADEMRQAGCVAISIGYESGSQRVLNLIDKGVRIDKVPGILRDLHRVGIGVQMMGFIGFPGETEEEAYSTFDFLRQHRDYWTLAGIGDFALTQGSMIAKRYRDFGITRIGPHRGDDIARALYWTDASDRIRKPETLRTTSINQIAKSLHRFAFDRPFVGGIDSSHSILYFTKYGSSLVPADMDENESVPGAIPTVHYRTPLCGVEQFIGVGDLQEYRSHKLESHKDVSVEVMNEWLSQYPPEATVENEQADEMLEIYPSGDFIAVTGEDSFVGEAYQLVKNLLLRGYGLA